MKFTKGKFWSQHIPECPERFQFHEGWIGEYGVAFAKSKNGKTWTATDLATGMAICIYPTRKECAEWVEENIEKIRAARLFEKCVEAAHTMSEFLKGELNGR